MLADMPAAKPAVSKVPSFEHEQALWQQGYRQVAGIDEVGRGPMAGPVVAGAVVLFRPEVDFPWLRRVRDSKLLSAKQREELAPQIWEQAAAVGIGVVSVEEIDAVGIVPATRRAMALAIGQLSCRPDYLLFDGRERLRVRTKQASLIKGDRLVLSIAAASIVAKVHRDRLMQDLEQQYPGWGFGQHKGYCTQEHIEALHRLGPSPVHRRCWAPVGALAGLSLMGALDGTEAAESVD